MKNPGADPASDPVVDVVAAQRGGDQRAADRVNVHAACGGERAGHEQERIAGEKRRHHQPRFAKHDQKQQPVHPGAVLCDERGEMRIEMDDEVPQLGDEFHAPILYTLCVPAIRVLPDLLVSQIAAGEVVERPASVLKELLENSLDAEARSITVTLDEGGAKRIQVEDDGAGVGRDDLPLALARHATSKIRSLEDLEGVRSMGFRGEALASIASVSRVSIAACTREAPHGAAIRAEGPHIGEVEPAALAPGTTVTVADLYFNTPARRKFLRSEATEFGHCDELFRRIALARPDIGFTFKHNGRVSRHLRSQPLGERIGALLGAEFLSAALPVEAQAGTARVFGYAGSPQARAEVQ